MVPGVFVAPHAGDTLLSKAKYFTLPLEIEQEIPVLELAEVPEENIGKQFFFIIVEEVRCAECLFVRKFIHLKQCQPLLKSLVIKTEKRAAIFLYH